MSAARTISATEFQRNLGAAMHEVGIQRRTVIVAKHGRSEFALVPISEYDELCKAREQLIGARLARLTTKGASDEQ